MRIAKVAAGVVAAGVVALSAQLPLWSMTMRAPQYPKGLHLYAYGTGMEGDLKELNILNHYIGMPAIEPPPLEIAMFPYGMAALIVLCLLSPFGAWLRRVAVAALVMTPVVVIADLQWRLYDFGHSLNPTAPIRLEPFTPLVIGTTKMGNFHSSAMVSWGFVGLLVAAAVLLLGNRLGRGRSQAARGTRSRVPLAAMFVAALFAPAITAADSSTLQARLDTAARGSTVRIDGGVHHGAIVVRGPLTVIGTNHPVIDGDGQGSVVTIEGDDVTFIGFTVRNSGRQVTEEAAGIKATGNRHRIEQNVVENVYFGIHVGGGAGVVVRDNEVSPGATHGARPGHGISVWNINDGQVLSNRVREARDGIYLSFTERVVVAGNQVTKCRYGLHSMYSQQATFADNEAVDNLLGAALMMSDRLVLRNNRIARHREGAAAYGVLLKDIGDLVAEGNQILSNRVGIYAEGVPANPARRAIFTGNTIVGNEIGLSLQSTAALTVSGNRIAENLTDVRALGRSLSAGMRWSYEGRGNSWSQYRGFDADRDGIGDVPHRVEDAMDALVRRNPIIQAFLYTPAHLAVEAAARMFPAFRQPPILVDERPLLQVRGGAR
jgi:nitrous oxidase accessory protein